jgi:hypothetical protein
LPRAKHDALTTATNLLQQFVIAQFPEQLICARGLRWLTRQFIHLTGLVAPGYNVREIAERTF